MKRTKIILNLLTVLALIATVGLGAFAVLYLVSGRGAGTQGYQLANLATLAVLTAILLQIAVIVLKFRYGQDVKRAKWGVVYLVALLVVGASGAIGPRLVPQLRSYDVTGLLVLIFVAFLALLELAVSWLVGWVRARGWR